LPGSHVVMVTVANGLGSISASLNVSVLYPVTVRHITAHPVTLGRPFVLEAVITGDLDFSVMVDYGDLSNVNSSSLVPHPDIVVTPLSDHSSSGSAPVYLVKVRHLYTSAGDYLISLSLANRLSHVTNSLTAHIVSEDFAVTLSANCQSPVASNLFVSLTATVSTSEDVQFNWICDRCMETPLVHKSVFFFVLFFCSQFHFISYFVH